jgi:hypothetical protein
MKRLTAIIMVVALVPVYLIIKYRVYAAIIFLLMLTVYAAIPAIFHSGRVVGAIQEQNALKGKFRALEIERQWLQKEKAKISIQKIQRGRGE